MKLTSHITLYCVLLLACAAPAVAQSVSPPEDPCGDPSVESSSWMVVRGRVVGVIDGDSVTVTVEKGKRIHVELIGIDAPERNQAFGRESRLLLESLVLNKVVKIWVSDPQFLRLRRSQTKVLTGVIHLPSIDMLDVNLLMIQAGMARHLPTEPYTMSNYIECHFVRAEDESRTARLGIWRGAATR